MNLRLRSLFTALFLTFFGTGAFAATDPSVFSVREVPVDATASGSVEARDTAIATGRARAFSALLRRLTLQVDWDKLPGPQSADLDRLVTGFEVSDERHSATRYLARVSYDFDPEGIRGILRGVGVPFSETRSKPVLVLPVLNGADGKPVLWDESNLWAAMWRQQPVGQALAPMRVPVGDLEDVAAAAGVSFDAPSWGQVEATANRIGAASAIMPIITLRQTAGKVLADIRMIEMSPSGTRESRFSADGANQDDAMLQGIAIVANAVVEAWKQQMVADDSSLSSLTADVSFSTLNQWISVRQALESVPFIREVRTIGLSAGAARVGLDYVGSSAQLATGLEQSDLHLSGSEETGWTIAPSGGTMASPDDMSAQAPVEPPVDKEAASGH